MSSKDPSSPYRTSSGGSSAPTPSQPTQPSTTVIYINGVGFEASDRVVASSLMAGAEIGTPTDDEVAEVLEGTPSGVIYGPGNDDNEGQGGVLRTSTEARAADASANSTPNKSTEIGSSTAISKDGPTMSGTADAADTLIQPQGPSTSTPQPPTTADESIIPLVNPSPSNRKFRIFIDEHYNDEFEGHVGPMSTDVNYDTTFRVFQARQIERQRTGTYKKSNALKVLATILLLALGGTLLAFYSVTSGIRTHSIGVAVILIFVPIACVVIWFTSIRFRGVFLTLCGAFVAFFVISLVYQDQGSAQYRDSGWILFVVFIVLFTLTVLFYLFFYVIWPRLILGNLRAFDYPVTQQWKIRQARNQQDGTLTGVFKYETYDSGWTIKTRHFSYRGQLDDQKRPHGLGEWSDDAFLGENLKGYFDHGLPVGPFISREFGTSNQFASVRLAIWRNVQDPWDHNYTFANARNKRGPQWGSVRGECSVGGNFFSMYPLAEQLIPPT